MKDRMHNLEEMEMGMPFRNTIIVGSKKEKSAKLFIHHILTSAVNRGKIKEEQMTDKNFNRSMVIVNDLLDEKYIIISPKGIFIH